MTPNATIHALHTRRESEGAPAALPTTDYPRLAEVLDRIRGVSARPEQAPVVEEVVAPEQRLAPDAAEHVVIETVHPDGVVLTPASTVPAAAPAPVAPSAYAAVAIEAPLPAPALPAPALPSLAPVADLAAEDADLHEVLRHLSLRETAREALRHRLIAFGAQTRQRTAYEIVFLMLAFSVMVLISAPPLIKLALAMHGVSQG